MKKHRNSVDQAGSNVNASVNRALRNALHTVFGRRGVASATSAGLLGAALCGLPISATGDGFPARLPLSSLDGTNGFTIRSSEQHTGAGKSVSGVGDFNGDGLDDVIIGARWADPNGVEDAGESYVLFGSAAAFPAVVELTALDGTNGFTLRGVQADDESGNVVSGAGDVNGDGIDDIVIGARNASGHAGEAYVVFGHVGTFAPVLDLSTLDGAIGFVTRGDSGAAASVSAAGDVNADGVGDLIVGAENSDSAYVVYGGRAPFDPLLLLADLDGSNGFVARGGESTGNAVSKGGDVNGDGIDDFIAGAYRADIGNLDNVGASYVVFGTAAGFPESMDLSALNGMNGFSVVGIQEFEEMGFAVSGIGDLNGDGVDDIAVGEPYARDTPCCDGRVGKCYVVFGSRAAFPAQLTVADLNGTNGFVAEGSGFNATACKSVSGAGDVNGDAVDDFIVGAPNANSQARIGRYTYDYEGAAYVVFGFQGAFPSVLELEHLDGTDGFKIEGIEDASETGESVAGAGDMNGDGVDDVIVGAGAVNEIYVVFGRITDADHDGVLDTVNNCLDLANADQRDTDQDAIGNACDPDFDQNCIVNFTDLGYMRNRFFVVGDRITDLNGDGVTNFVDLAALKSTFFEPPGPSGLPNSCGV